MNAKRILNPTRWLLRLAGPAALFLAMATSAAAEDCKTMLKPRFDWIQQSSSSTVFPVVLTLTAHSIHSGALAFDLVEVAFGWTMLSGDVLTSTAGVYSNHPSNTIQRLPQLSYRVTISRTGWVSIQKLVEGKSFLGRPPLQFQGVCSKGLVTGVVDSSSYTLSLKKQPDFPIIK